MALLKIIKLAEGVWKHWSDKDGFFALTRLYAKIEENKFLIVEAYGAKRRKYSANEIEVYDIGGSVETFANFDDLQIRLKELNYIGYDSQYSGGTVDPTKVPLTRTLTFNGVTLDLSANRSWTIVDDSKVPLTRTVTINGDTQALSSNLNFTVSTSSKRSFTCCFGISQNVSASPTGNTQWFRKDTATGNNVTASFTLQTNLDVTTNFATHSVLGPCYTLPFQAKIKSVHVRGWTNTTNSTGVDFVILKSKENSPNIPSSANTISNALIIARETVQIYASGFPNGFLKEFSSGSLNTSTLPSGSDIRLVFKNFNSPSNMFDTIVTVEFEEVI